MTQDVLECGLNDDSVHLAIADVKIVAGMLHQMATRDDEEDGPHPTPPAMALLARLLDHSAAVIDRKVLSLSETPFKFGDAGVQAHDHKGESGDEVGVCCVGILASTN